MLTTEVGTKRMAALGKIAGAVGVALATRDALEAFHIGNNKQGFIKCSHCHWFYHANFCYRGMGSICRTANIRRLLSQVNSPVGVIWKLC